MVELINQIELMDCFKYLKQIKNESIDFICIDPPYGKINGMILSGQKEKINWDHKINWDVLFKEYKRIIKKGGTIAVFGQQPTYSNMITNKILDFKYEFIWEKNNCSQGFNSDKMPLIYTENIAVFIKPGLKRTFNKPSKGKEINKNKYFNRWYSQQLYYLIGKSRRGIHKDFGHRKLEFYFLFVGKHFGLCSETLYNDLIEKYKIDKWKYFKPYKYLKEIYDKEKKWDKESLDSTIYNGTLNNILKFKKDYKPYYHPTQKPIKLIEHLIKIYTNKNDIVLDTFMGSGTTAVACQNLNRNFMGCELDQKYYDIALGRINYDDKK